jgi:hypothetical protein
MGTVPKFHEGRIGQTGRQFAGHHRGLGRSVDRPR